MADYVVVIKVQENMNALVGTAHEWYTPRSLFGRKKAQKIRPMIIEEGASCHYLQAYGQTVEEILERSKEKIRTARAKELKRRALKEHEGEYRFSI